MGRKRKDAETTEIVAKIRTNKQTKELARKVIKEVTKKDTTDFFNATFVGFKFSEKGGFASIIFSVEAVVDVTDGRLSMTRDIEFPISLDKDIIVK